MKKILVFAMIPYWFYKVSKLFRSLSFSPHHRSRSPPHRTLPLRIMVFPWFYKVFHTMCPFRNRLLRATQKCCFCIVFAGFLKDWYEEMSDSAPEHLPEIIVFHWFYKVSRTMWLFRFPKTLVSIGFRRFSAKSGREANISLARTAHNAWHGVQCIGNRNRKLRK